ncbi:MAG: TMEM165/GDT1 family protein [Nitrososphaerota archaeon]|nr:TMEM165/GDT1 family protein [Nitrososphaerota archaeon]
MSDLLASFGTIAAVLFVTELTDKDAFLLIAVSSKVKWRVAFFAGATAFTLNTLLFVAAGSLIVAFVPVNWVRLAGGVVMLGYGLWEAKGLVGKKAAEEEETRVQKARSPWGAFLALVAALSLLDLAGDATEVLTIVFVAQYADPPLVFTGVIAGLIAATALETTLGNRLGRILTPSRLRYLSMGVFIALGAAILLVYS